MPTLLSLVALQVVVMTHCGATVLLNAGIIGQVSIFSAQLNMQICFKWLNFFGYGAWNKNRCTLKWKCHFDEIFRMQLEMSFRQLQVQPVTIISSKWRHFRLSLWPTRGDVRKSRHPFPLQWRHNERDGVSNHQPQDCLLNRLFRHRSKKTLMLRVTGLREGNSPVTGEFLAQRPVTRKMFPIDDVLMIEKTSAILAIRNEKPPVTSGFPIQGVNNLQLWYFPCYLNRLLTFEMPVIWDAMTPIWRYFDILRCRVSQIT